MQCGWKQLGEMKVVEAGKINKNYTWRKVNYIDCLYFWKTLKNPPRGSGSLFLSSLAPSPVFLSFSLACSLSLPLYQTLFSPLTSSLPSFPSISFNSLRFYRFLLQIFNLCCTNNSNHQSNAICVCFAALCRNGKVNRIQ